MFSQCFLLFAAIVSVTSLRNGDKMEFYVSGKDLPGVNGSCGYHEPCTGTGRFGFLWKDGILLQGGYPIMYFDQIETELIENKSPVWSSDIVNITHIDINGAWSMHRIIIWEEAKTKNGRLIRGRVADLEFAPYSKVEENIAKSCTTKEPFVLTQKTYNNLNITLLFHCTKFVPVK